MIIVDSFNVCFSPGLRLALDTEPDLSLDELVENSFCLSNLALVDVDETVMVDEAFEVEFDRS